jgi:acyl-coenzyme A synthetase/AMP-(fatty) acid ligase
MTLPLIVDADSNAPLLWANGQSVSRRDFARDARRLAATLPNARYAINLCQDRARFMLGFVAGCARGQTQLLPANQTEGALQSLAEAYPDHYVLDDARVGEWLSASAMGPASLGCAGDHIAAIAFTSGSTGKPQPHSCSWSMLSAAGRRSATGIFSRASGETAGSTLNVVATVPPQHMFGLETTVVQPLIGRCAVHVSKPFFPGDVAAVLHSLPAPRALVTTPTHLRALVAANTRMPELAFVLSATAPLSNELAAHAESLWRTEVREIYGSTETGAIATRRTTDGDTWTVLPGGCLKFDVADEAGRARFRAGEALPEVVLHDRLDRINDEHFVLAGRSGDLIKVAGKRASLAELNARLLAIPGVRDGVMLQPQPDGRVAALAVAEIPEAQILAALARNVDEVFLPRPLRLVAALPRDSLGKLPRAQLLAALGLARSERARD